MLRRARKEAVVLVVGGTIFFAFIFNGIMYARSQVRDNLRQTDFTNLKHALEQYNNAHGYYVGPPAGAAACTSSGPASWFFGEGSPLLNEQFIDAISHDVRESRGQTYTYCAMGKTEGYYLEARLESHFAEGVFFDDDEHRKFGYRVLTSQGHLLYRVCGGTETQCSKE